MLSRLTIFGLAGISGAALLIVLLAILAFEIAMFVAVIQNKRLTDNAKLWWILGMLLFHPVVAIVYYFTDHQK